MEQAPETVHGIKLLMSFIPSGIAFASAGVALFYGITPEVAQRIETDLAERRGAET